MKVAICTPAHSDPKIQYTGSLAALLIHTAQQRPELHLGSFLAQGHLINTRNKIAANALDWGADWLLWIDADTQFPQDGLLALLDDNLPIVCANYPTRNHPPGPTIFIERAGGWQPVFSTPGIAKRMPLQEVSSAGLGFCLISAEAIRKAGMPIFLPKPGHHLFLGEDEYLFERLRAGGEKVYVDHRVSLNVAHAGDYSYTNQVAAHFAQQVRTLQPSARQS